VLHYLVHSAGVVRGWHELTREGIESNLAINYVSRFALTLRLLRFPEARWQARAHRADCHHWRRRPKRKNSF